MTSCREIKHTLTGATQIYACELLVYRPGFGILKYVIDREYRVHGYALLPGDITYALYWEDRPYTLYIWDLRRLNSRLYYFNIADSVHLTPDEFAWRDLVIDILIDRDRQPVVLDEDELPNDLSATLRSSIADAQTLVLQRYPDIIHAADALIFEALRDSIAAPRSELSAEMMTSGQ